MTAKPIVFIALLTILTSQVVAFAAEKPAVDYRPPQTILSRIVEMAGEQECPSDQARPLGSNYFTALDESTLLILLELPDYLCDKSNSVVPLLADVKGRWILGDHLSGLPVFFGHGPDKSLWMVTQWQVEGTYPSLFQSQDGLHWQEIPLPPGPEPGSPFIFLDRMCFKNGKLQIRLTSENGAENPPSRSYSAGLKELASGKAVWTDNPNQKMDASVVCNPPMINLSGWQLQASPETREIVFYRDEIKLIIPTEIIPHP